MQGKTIIGFELKRPLGEGGMAEVWYAENEIGKPAAVKILNKDLSHNDQIVERFKNEAKIMVKLDHPNIRQVYGYGELDGRHAIVQEYIDGDDLKALLNSGRRFTDAEIEKWWNQMVDALNYTHSMGIVHRDIKPSNIFIDRRGNVRLLDFGIAKIKEGFSMTQTGAMMGTLMYMSSEQVRDSKHIDYRTDVYSLAVTFVHLLTGRAPYDTNYSDDYTIRKGIVELSLDMTGVPDSWQQFLEPYLAKNPQQRPVLMEFNGKSAPEPNAKTIVGANYLSEETIIEGSVWVDLGLPSGTLWKDKNESGFYDYDAAVRSFGRKLPTKEQFEELKESCQWTWTGNGYNVVGPSGKSIFLHAEGRRNCYGSEDYVGSDGGYWSSTPDDSNYAWYFRFNSGEVSMRYYDRCDGRSVRLVRD